MYLAHPRIKIIFFSTISRLLLVLTGLSISFADAQEATFASSKRQLSVIYQNHPETFYCGCSIDYTNAKASPDLDSCFYKARKQVKRANRIEWEHVVPASILGGNLACWTQGGRKACKKDPVFSEMESDMHNLVPSIGEVNGDRSNRRFGYVANEPRAYGACDFEIDFGTDLVEPREEVRGDIARIWKYAQARYSVVLSSEENKMFDTWDRLDPVSRWECEKDKIVLRLQGNSNPFVSNDCQ